MNSILLLPSVAVRLIDLICNFLTALLLVYVVVIIAGVTILYLEKRRNKNENGRVH